MSNPFLIEGPAVIAFSGGRTSGMMLYKIIEAHGGKLPDDVIPVFCNTGKEHDKTLDFVRDCGLNWNTTIRWIEFVNAELPSNRWREVDYASASREGEPFEAVINRIGIPNPMHRFCTTEMKVRATHRFVKSIGWKEWSKAVGLRYDEPHRVAKARIRDVDRRDEGDLYVPLYDAGVTVREVTAFWAAQSFDLGLPNHNGVTPLGNCDLCFLKGAGKIASTIAVNPERGVWWARMEKEQGSVFRIDRPSYAAMIAQGNLALSDDSPDNIDCACTE